MTTASNIQQHIRKVPYGKPFTTAMLLEHGARATVDQTLSRLVTAGKITRLTRGVYVRPEHNRFVGTVMPEPFQVAQAIAKKTNETVQVSGAEAARHFGLSTQVSAHPIFLTSGRSKRFHIGHLEVTLKHVSKKKIPLAGSNVGLAILALWYLGKQLVNAHTIATIEKKLTAKEFENFISSKQHMPAWMSNMVLQYESTREKHA